MHMTKKPMRIADARFVGGGTLFDIPQEGPERSIYDVLQGALQRMYDERPNDESATGTRRRIEGLFERNAKDAFARFLPRLTVVGTSVRFKREDEGVIAIVEIECMVSTWFRWTFPLRS